LAWPLGVLFFSSRLHTAGYNWCAVGGESTTASTGQAPLVDAEGGQAAPPPADVQETQRTSADAGVGGAASADAVGGSAPATETAEPASAEAVAAPEFLKLCVVHATATLYIAATLAPKPGQVTFWMRAVAVFMTLLIFGWTLVAPAILRNRDFS